MIPAQFVFAHQFSEGLATVSVKGPEGERFGFIDRSGRFVIRPRFEWAGSFKEGMASFAVGTEPPGGGEVDISGLHGYIDTRGEIRVEPRFSMVYQFRNGLGRVEIWKRGHPSRIGYVDKSGKFIWKPTS